MYFVFKIPWADFKIQEQSYQVKFTFNTKKNETIQVFYSTLTEKKFNEKNSLLFSVKGAETNQSIEFSLKEKPDRLRLDLFEGKNKNSIVKPVEFRISYCDASVSYSDHDFFNLFKANNFVKRDKKNNTISPIFLEDKSFDPYVISKEIPTQHLSPSYSWQFSNYINTLDRFFTTNIPWKEQLIKEYGLILLKFFNSSSIPKKLIVGKDGWLFLGNSFDRVLDDFLRIDLPDSNDLRSYSKRYLGRARYYDRKNIDYLVSYFPNKSTVYASKMPDSYLKAREDTLSRAEIISEHLMEQPQLKFVNNLKDFEASRDEYKIYCQNDSHWTDIGAFIAYSNILETLSTSVHYSKLEWGDFIIRESLSDKYDLSSFFEFQPEELIPYLEAKHHCDQYKLNEIESSVVKTRNYDALNFQRVVIFRDSFSEALIPFFSSTFCEVIYIWEPFNLQKANSYRPDIIIEANVERLMFR